MGKGKKARRGRRVRGLRNVFAKIGLDEQAVELLNNYAKAFACFYGRIDLKTALEIINEQNDNQFSEEQFLGFMKTKRRNTRQYFVIDPKEYFDDIKETTPLDWELIEESLLSVDEEYYYDLVKLQKGKPICVLPKEELFKYIDEFYYERTPETEALEKFIEENAKIIQPSVPVDRATTAHDLVEEYVIGVRISTDDDPSEEDDVLRLIELPADKDECQVFLAQLAHFTQEVYNTTRLWANRGYTPIEMLALMGSE